MTMLANEKTRRSQVERRDESYRRMIDAGIRLVAERGLDALTLAEVGKAAGYSRGLPAHHFGSKREFEAELIAHLHRQYQEAMEIYKSKTGLADLIQLVKSLFENADSDPNRLCSMHIFLSPNALDADLWGELKRCRDETALTFEHQISEGIKKGEIRADVDARLTSLTLMLAVNGFLGQWLQDRTIDLQAAGEQLAQLLLRGLAVPNAAEKKKAKPAPRRAARKAAA